MVRRESLPGVVFCGLQWPRFPGRSGGEIRDFHLLRALLETHRLRFFAAWDTPGEGREDPLRGRLEDWQTPSTAERILARDGRLARAVQRIQSRGWPLVGARLPADVAAHRASARGLAPIVRHAIQRDTPDLLFVSPQVNPVRQFLDPPSPRTRSILASYDVEAVRIERFAEASHGLDRVALRLESRRARSFEGRNLATFDGVIAVSELDASLYRSRYGVPAERLVVIENGVDPDYFVWRPREARVGPATVIFTGAMGYRANEDAAWRLIRAIVPRVRRSREVRLALVGQKPNAGLCREHDGERTVVTGAVEDVRPYLAQASVTCVPLRAGSGTKIKILESLSAGVPVVCSSIAAEGLAVVHDEHVLVADTDEALARAVARVLDDPALAARLAAAGRSLIEARYAWSLCLKPLAPWLDHVRRLPPGSLS